LNGDYTIGRFENHLTVGMDYSREHRNPTLGYSRAFTASIDPYDRASWPASGRLQPILTQNRHKADSYGIFVQNIFSATPDLKFVLGGRYDKYTFNSE
ncbi:TonB-dependent receptor, partial [Klebsiella pneumoniae]|nr:TonB-dependent receptor [Klebsiella pneumoniae]